MGDMHVLLGDQDVVNLTLDEAMAVVMKYPDHNRLFHDEDYGMVSPSPFGADMLPCVSLAMPPFTLPALP